MRKLYCKFPNHYDTEFEVDFQFSKVLKAITSLSGRRDNFRITDGLVRRDYSVYIPTIPNCFEKINSRSVNINDISEEVDFKVTVYDSLLKSTGNRPISEHEFLIKIRERGQNNTDIFIVKLSQTKEFDADALKTIIIGVIA